jgi:hypothetical protein
MYYVLYIFILYVVHPLKVNLLEVNNYFLFCPLCTAGVLESRTVSSTSLGVCAYVSNEGNMNVKVCKRTSLIIILHYS